MDDERELEAVGWNAIDEALTGVHGDLEPKHGGTILPYMLGGKDPLPGLRAFRDIDDGASWHFVTYGFSELYEKEWEDPEMSGIGVVWQEYEKDAVHPKTGELATAVRRRLSRIYDLPMRDEYSQFVQDLIGGTA
jgi:hypothetical protein